MTKSIGWLWAGALVVLIGAGPVGCKKDEPAEEPAVAEGEAAPGEREGDVAAPGEGEAPAEEGTPAEGAQPAEGEAPAAGKETLAKAYLEIYCAQRKGETEQLLEIYTKYGFEDPKAWTRAWTEASEDAAWVARITEAAVRECP